MANGTPSTPTRPPGLSLLKRLHGDWDAAKGYLKQDLEKIQRWANSIPGPPTSLQPRVVTVQSSPQPAIDVTLTDVYALTDLQTNILSFSANLQGTPIDGQNLTIRIFDSSTHTIVWGPKFISNGAALPTSSVAGVALYVQLQYNAVQGLWECLAVGDGTPVIPVVPAALTEVNDTNVTLSLGGTPSTALLKAVSLTLGWTGTLAAGRLNANVVQSVTNDTNVTGSISGQNLTFGWSGKLGLSRGGTNADLSATGGASQVLKQTTSGAAVTVGQLATTDMSDYQTGTWTPIDASGASLSFSIAQGNYVKIGRLVIVNTVVVYPSTASGLTAKIGGFPFTAANISNMVTAVYPGGGPASVANFLPLTTTCVFSLANGTGSATNANYSGLAVIFMGVYFT